MSNESEESSDDSISDDNPNYSVDIQPLPPIKRIGNRYVFEGVNYSDIDETHSSTSSSSKRPITAPILNSAPKKSATGMCRILKPADHSTSKGGLSNRGFSRKGSQLTAKNSEITSQRVAKAGSQRKSFYNKPHSTISTGIHMYMYKNMVVYY